MEVKKNNHIPIVFATNENYAPYAGVCIQSIIENSSNKYFYDIYVFHVGLTDKTISLFNKIKTQNLSVSCVNISKYISKIKCKLYSHSYFSNEMYYRILIPDVLPQYDKILYLDCDMIVLSDVAELYKTDIGENCIGACRNLMHSKMIKYVSETLNLEPKKYINSGMILINCKQFKIQKVKSKIFNLIESFKNLSYPDQDLINLACKDKIYYFELNWNYLWHLERLNKSTNIDLHLSADELKEFEHIKSNIKILHFTGDKKPWQYNAIDGSEKFWNFAINSVFYNIILNKFLSINSKLQKIKLMFAEFDKDNLNITCSYNVLNENNKDSYLYFVNNNLYKPNIFLKRKIIINDVFIYQRLFSIKISKKELKNNKNIIFFTINGKNVLFEYDKFFPLNGSPKSYFAYNGKLMYRLGKSLIIEKCTFLKRLKYELSYLNNLRKIKQKKQVAIRILYFLTKKLVPKNIWLISDRPNVAGDNGEALFKFLRHNNKNYKKINPYFVISKNCDDYKRLKKDGHIIRLSSLKHKIFALHCNGKAVSQTDKELYDVIERNYLKDLLYKENRVFLQHGITKDDVSSLYSKFNHNFNMFVTASIPEYESIISNKNYGCGKSITKLTGFPRHDLLENKEENLIIINPTWRLNLWKQTEDEFIKSDYFEKWNSFLNNNEFNLLLTKNNLKAIFVLHNNMNQFSHCFKLSNDNIKINNNIKFSNLFSMGCMYITDYSSNAFEFAYLRKPVCYFQFDSNEFFEKHSYNKGYYDYEENGFGKVTKTITSLIQEINNLVNNDFIIDDKYAERIDKFFKFSDKNNSKRVADEMLKLKR